MSGSSSTYFRKVIKRFHTEGIPWHSERIISMINTEHWPNGLAELVKTAAIGGPDLFQELHHAREDLARLLAGGRQMDLHFRQAPMEENMPVMLAMLANWYNNFFGAQSQAILPYDNRLERFPAYLQQLQMESSGKSVRMDGKPVKCNTGMIIWGEAGNNAQHSFYQLLHQGTRLVPVDFLLPARSSGASQFQQDLAIANCLAQSEALMDGHDEQGLESYRVHKGNNPSNLILFQELTPETLVELIALYEHKVFVEGVLWGIDSFDQWGVELGKRLAKNVEATSNPSTKSLLARINRLK